MRGEKLHVGTSGWSYDHWQGLFYPKEMQSSGRLSYYAEHFNCVELNTTFYGLPEHSTILNWKNRSPDGFFFCPKLSRYLTHQKKLHDKVKSRLSQGKEIWAFSNNDKKAYAVQDASLFKRAVEPP